MPQRLPAPRTVALMLALSLTALTAPIAGATDAGPACTPPYLMKSGQMQCGSHLSFDVKADDAQDTAVDLTWKGRHYHLAREATTTGAYHFDDPKTGLTLIQIPAKSMLLDHKNMVRLADDCNPVDGSQIASK